jgi:hypothetical protein
LRVGRRRSGREHEEGQFASRLVGGVLEEAVAGGEPHPQRFGLPAGNLAGSNVEGPLADLDAGVRVRTQVEVPAGRAGGAGVGGDYDERVAGGEVRTGVRRR